MISHSSGESGPGFFKMASGTPILPMSCRSPACPTVSTTTDPSPSADATRRLSAATRSECPRVYGSFASSALASPRSDWQIARWSW